MIFPYRIWTFPGEGDEVHVIERPVISVTVIGPNRRKSTYALVDTGSDHSIFPASLLRRVGIDCNQGKALPADVFGGGHVKLIEAEAILQLKRDGVVISWQAPVCSYDDAINQMDVAILGRSGCLDFFTAVFDGEQGILTMTPNSQLLAAAVS